MGWLWTVVLQSYASSGPVVMFWYPLIASIMAIESPNKGDDQLWLTYWVLYSLVSHIELVAAPVIAWIPFYSTIKLVIALWLVLPQFRGGVVLYEKFVRPYFNTPTELTFSNGQRKWSAYISPSANKSAAVYIKTKGAGAFEELMKSATKNSKVEEIEKVENVEEKYSSPKYKIEELPSGWYKETRTE